MQNLKLWLLCSALSVAFNLSAADASETFKVSEFTFVRPKAWKWIPTASTMRKAQLQVDDKASGKSAEVIFFHFGAGQGGDTQANIDRWLGSFQEPRDKVNAKTEKVAVGSGKITYVEAEGTYLSGMPGGPKTPLPNSVLLGAIVESAEGNIFIRMTGPAALVKESKAAFRSMSESPFKK